MKTYAIFLFVAFTGYASKAQSQEIDFSGKSVLHVSYLEKPQQTVSLNISIYHSFPAYDYSEVNDSINENKLQAWLTIPTRLKQLGYLSIGEKNLEVFLIPNDTVHIVVSKSLSITFGGKTQPIQSYYLEKRRKFPIRPTQMGMNIGIEAKNLADFKPQFDSITNEERGFWEQYRATHQLPDWFVRFESDAIQYDDAMLRLYMISYQIDYQKKKQKIPTHYYDFLKQVTVRNTEAQYDYAYLMFLRDYINWRVRKSGLSNYEATFKKLTTQILGNKLANFFQLWTLSSGAKDNPEVTYNELQKKQFLAEYAYLVSYLRERSTKVASVLKAGDKAPVFYLADVKDSLVSLQQFKGQIVYLCFWYAGCGGCLHEFPFENKLVQQFKGKPVKIVSICTSTPLEKWQAVLKKEKLQTQNLFANLAWKKTLTEKYAISTYPHYVLIDSNGKVVKNFASRPSNNAANEIQQLLDEAK